MSVRAEPDEAYGHGGRVGGGSEGRATAGGGQASGWLGCAAWLVASGLQSGVASLVDGDYLPPKINTFKIVSQTI
jgi:hypothetical protein